MKYIKSHITREDIMSLIDGVFACAMTLMFFSIDLPSSSEVLSKKDLYKHLFESFQDFICYIIVFCMLILFWVRYHTQFHYIYKTDRKHLFINIMLGITVMLIPFSNYISSDFVDDPLVQGIFGLNILFMVLMFNWNWRYSIHNNRLIDPEKVDKEDMAQISELGIFDICVGVLAVIVAIIYPQMTPYILVLIPVEIFVKMR